MEGEQLKLTCPFCGNVAPVSEYIPYVLPPGKKGYVQIYRCEEKGCKFCFAPKEEEVIMEKAENERSRL